MNPLRLVLGLPYRLLRGLDAGTEVIRTLPGFERALITRLDGLRIDVHDLRADVSEVRSDLAATRTTVSELNRDVGDAVEHLPGHDDDERGPIARARDAITRTDQS